MIDLLLAGALRHYGWPFFPTELQGMASKGFGALAILALLWHVWWSSARTKIIAAVLLWWAWEELQVVLCSLIYMHKPWNVPPGVGICSALVGIDLGALGILIVAVLALHLTRKTNE